MSPSSRAVVTLLIGTIGGWILASLIVGSLLRSITSDSSFFTSTQTTGDRLGFALASGVLVLVSMLAARWTRHHRLSVITHEAFYLSLGLLACFFTLLLSIWQTDLSGIEVGISHSGHQSHAATYVLSEVHIGYLPLIGVATVVILALGLRLLTSRLTGSTTPT